MRLDPGEGDEDRLMRDAAGWFARMRAPDAEASRPHFEAWLAADADHRRAYNRASEIFAFGKLLGQPEAGAAPAVALAPRRRVPMAAVMAALLALGAGGWLATRPLGKVQDQRPASLAAGHVQPPPELAAGDGKPRAEKLTDGSRIVLAGGTRVRLFYTATERRLVLLEGRARFDVFHESRPFVVAAGGGTVTARGTMFDVLLGPDRRVTVQLIRGRVDVALPAVHSMIPVRTLVPGQRLSFTAPPLAPASAMASGPPATETGAREYDGVALASLIAEANRKAARPIEIDPSLGERRVSGRFRIDETGLLADRLATLFELRVDRTDPAKLVLKPR